MTIFEWLTSIQHELLTSVITLVIIAGVSLIIGLAIHNIGKAAGIKTPQLKSFRDIVFVFAAIVAAISLLGITGLSNQFTALTFSGIVGLAISLALQSTLTNFISGMMLMHDRAVVVGDVIQSQSLKGQVIQVGFRATWLKTNDGSIIMIANSNLSSNPLINFTSKDRRMI